MPTCRQTTPNPTNLEPDIVLVGLNYCTMKAESQNPVSASAMLTEKFLQIRKVFATSSLLAEEFPDTLQYYAKCLDELESFRMI